MKRWQIVSIPLALLVAVPLLGPLALGANGEGPVALWTFNGEFRRLSRDVASDTHHAIAMGDYEHTEAPGLRAIVLDGVSDFLRVPDDPALVMTDALTIDVWLRIDTDEGGPHCVVDKRGERYRIHVSGGRPMFGLKSADERMDLSGGELQPGRWHRVTGVFDRPEARLYVDGEQVGRTTWDHEISPGGDLIIGSKAGVTDFFPGAIDELRIYDYARSPHPDDEPSTEPIGVIVIDAELAVEEIAGGVRVDTGAAVYELTDDAALRSLTIGEHAVMTDNDLPLLAASIFESAEYDGWRDYAPGEVTEATWRAGEHAYETDDERFVARYTGALDFGGADTIDCELSMEALRGSPFLTATVALTRDGEFTDRFLRDISLRLPLALDRRKRVVQGGDRGIQWNTRHFFQFHVSPTQRLLNEPDHNIWRNFAIDQNSPADFNLWRSESTATPSLSMQRGEQAPGWMAVYDERAGLIFGYRDFAERAPKSLRVHADGPGEARVCLWHEGLRALSPASPQAEVIFGEPHVIDLGVFADEFTFAQPDLALTTHRGLDSLVSDPPNRNEVPFDGINPLAEESAETEAPLITGGVPLPRGAVSDPANVRLQREGADVPLQAKPVGYWPDGSIMWLLLTFPPEGGEVAGAAGTGDALQFDVTRRDGSAGAFTLLYGGDCAAGTPAEALAAEQDGDVVRIDTGRLQLELAADEGWLRSAVLDGREMLSAPGGSFVDFLRTDVIYPSMTAHPEGELDPGAFVPGTIELEEAGPLRAMVKLTGMTTAQDSPRMVLRLEAYAGRSCARIEQSVEFLHPDPREAFVRRMGLELPIVDAGGTVTAGGQDGPVALEGGRRAGLRQHSHLGYTAWSQRAEERFLRIGEAQNRSRGWLDVSGEDGGVAMMIRDAWQNFPTEIVLDAGDGRMTAYFWPESEPLMDVRRYSNYPHRSQGESTPSDSSWVSDVFYENEPFVGVTRTHELLIAFHGPEVDAETVDALAGDFDSRPLVYCGAEWYIDNEVVPPQPPPGAPGFERMEANHDHYADFWIHHQRLWGWYGCWDYGDTQHYYKGGYGWIVPPDRLAELLVDPPDNYEEIDVRQWRIGDYAPGAEWAFDNGRWGWTNTEGLPGLLMQIHYLRTGDRDAFFFSEAMARHVRDVDMRHAGQWFGRGTRHGVQHWSCGNHEERQTTNSEFRYHYFLTGEPRSRDFVQLLYEDYYSQENIHRHAGHSGRSQGLLTWWLMTGDDEVGSVVERYMSCFPVEEGISISPEIRFPEVECVSQDDRNNASMFFWTFGGAHALLEYFYLTGHEGLRHAFIGAADHAMRQGDNPGNLRKAVAFAALHADDPTPYREYLQSYVHAADIMVQVVPHNPDFYGGARGMLRGSVAGSLFWLNDKLYMMAAIDGDPELDERKREQIERVDAEGGRPYTPSLLSWQSEYDRPDLEEYLRIKHPQP